MKAVLPPPCFLFSLVALLTLTIGRSDAGPVEFAYVGYNGSLPSLHLNPFTWTQVLSIIYVDAPIGTGFSYSTTAENYYTDDHKSSEETYQFLRKWMRNHPQYLTNILFIGGDSYSGIPLPMIVEKAVDGNSAGLWPYLNVKGAGHVAPEYKPKECYEMLIAGSLIIPSDLIIIIIIS